MEVNDLVATCTVCVQKLAAQVFPKFRGLGSIILTQDMLHLHVNMPNIVRGFPFLAELPNNARPHDRS